MKVFLYTYHGSVCRGNTLLEAQSNIVEIATKSVPSGIGFYIVDEKELPDTPQETWEISGDFDGMGEA